MASISAYDRMSYNNMNLPSLQEMMIAPSYMQQQHDTALEESAKISAEANVAATYAMEDPNSKAAQAYQAYIGDLNKATEALSNKGFKGSNIKSALSNAKARYSSDIMPIIQAGAVRQKDMATLKEMAAKDQTLLYNPDPSQYSIDAYIARGNTSYMPNAISGAQLEKATAESLKNLSDQLRTNGAKMFSKTNLPFEYMAYIQRGATVEEVDAAMKRQGYVPSEVNTMTNLIRKTIEGTLQTHGVFDKFGDNPELLARAFDFSARGAYAALGKQDIQFKTDDYGMRVSLMDREQAIKDRDKNKNINPFRQVSLLENNKEAIVVAKEGLAEFEKLYGQYLDPKTPLVNPSLVNPSKMTSTLKTSPSPYVSQFTESGKEIFAVTPSKNDVIKQMREMSKKYGFDIFGPPDANGKRTLKPLETIRQEFGDQITNLAVLTKVDALDVNTPEATNSLLSKISDEGTAFKDARGERLKVNNFIETDKNGNKTLKEGTTIIPDARTKRVIFRTASGKEGYLNLDNHPTIKAAFELYQDQHFNRLFGYTDPNTGNSYDFRSYVDAMNESLESSGKGYYKIDLSKYDLNSNAQQLKLANDISERDVELRKDEVIPVLQQEYQSLPSNMKQRVSEQEYINKGLYALKNQMVQSRIARVSADNTAPITNIVGRDLLNITKIEPNEIQL